MLGDGFVSAVISFLRMLVFQIVMVMLLPLLLKSDGILKIEKQSAGERIRLRIEADGAYPAGCSFLFPYILVC